MEEKFILLMVFFIVKFSERLVEKFDFFKDVIDGLLEFKSVVNNEDSMNNNEFF